MTFTLALVNIYQILSCREFAYRQCKACCFCKFQDIVFLLSLRISKRICSFSPKHHMISQQNWPPFISVGIFPKSRVAIVFLYSKVNEKAQPCRRKNTENFHNIMMHYILKNKPSLVAQMVKNLLTMEETQLDPLVRKIPWRREWLLTPVFLTGESHEQRSLMGYSAQVCKQLDRIDQHIYNTIVVCLVHTTNQ